MDIKKTIVKKVLRRDHLFKYKGDVVTLRGKPELHGTFYKPEKAKNDVGIVICHGISLARKLFEPMALEIRDRGFNVLTFTFRGHGWRRKGKLTLEKALEDVKTATEYMKRVKKHKKIILVGHSLGAIMSLKAAVRCSDVAGVVLIGCPTSLSSARIRSKFVFFASKIFASVDVVEILKQLGDFDSITDIKKTKVPVLFVYGEFDEILTFFGQKKAVSKMAEGKNIDIEIVPAMGHIPVKKKCYKIIADWVEKRA